MKDKWNLNQLANMLNQEEERLKQLEQHSVHLVSQRAQRKWRKLKKGIKHGPLKANEPNPNVQAHKKEIGNDKYHFCKKLGHYQKVCSKCRQWFEKKGKCLITGFVSVCFESNLTEVPSNTWWLDSAATTHVSNTMQ